MNNKVYVTNFTGFEYSEAEKFGEMVFMTEGYVDFKNINKVTEKLAFFIQKSKPDDYLLLSGNNLLCAIALHHWLMFHGTCKVLHWQLKNYVEYIIERGD